MRLLTKTLEKKLPPLYSTDGQGMNAKVIVKFFCLKNDWHWYATEYSPEDKIFFGYVCGFDQELGTFSLEEFESINREGSFPIMERDLYFTPKTLRQALVADGYSAA